MTFPTSTAAGSRPQPLRQLLPPPIMLSLYGRSGCGKGTQVQQLVAALGCHVVGMGDQIRHIAQNPHDPDQAACATSLATGEFLLIPITLRIIRAQVLAWQAGRQNPASSLYQSPGLIFDGVTRTLVQAVYLDAQLEMIDHRLTALLAIDVPADVCRQRLAGRQRADDHTRQITRRLANFDENCPAVMAYYTDGVNRPAIGHTLNGHQAIDAVTADLFNLLATLGP